MSSYSIEACQRAFEGHCACDQTFIEEIERRFPMKVRACGMHLLDRCKGWSYTLPENTEEAEHYQEFLDFLDGNGFILKQVRPNLYHITPEYPEITLPSYDWE